MKYVITGGAGNISKPLTEILLQGGHQVTVIGRNAANLQSLTDAGAVAAIGSVEDIPFLTRTFAGADAIYTMVPPVHATTDWKAHIGKIGKNYAAAIQESGVKYVVNLSSVGAHLAEGVGPVSGLYRAEQALNTLTGVAILHLRPPYFYNNLLANIGMIQGMGMIGANFAVAEKKFPLVAPADIAVVAAEALQSLSFSGHSVRYLASDIVSTDEIAAVLGAAIGKPDLTWTLFTDEQALGGMLQAGLPEEMAKNYAEMNHAIQTGDMYADFFKQVPEKFGKTKLTDFAKIFAQVYNGK
ncbi:MAG: NmrA family NAD(P)-binding protein [Bacteroidota bacterium]|nr:NmrA family NAD(P)-binding protein [Bacteroidota bacterium]